MNPFVAAYVFVITRLAGRKERGATAVEYGLLAALIAVVIISAVAALGGRLDAIFTDITSKI